jgi:hypothetical protein
MALGQGPAGNNGSGIPYKIDSAANIAAILIGGNDSSYATNNLRQGSGALYCGAGVPSFSAVLGSMYIRTDGSATQLLYVNTDGATAWRPFA